MNSCCEGSALPSSSSDRGVRQRDEVALGRVEQVRQAAAIAVLGERRDTDDPMARRVDRDAFEAVLHVFLFGSRAAIPEPVDALPSRRGAGWGGERADHDVSPASRDRPAGACGRRDRRRAGRPLLRRRRRRRARRARPRRRPPGSRRRASTSELPRGGRSIFPDLPRRRVLRRAAGQGARRAGHRHARRGGGAAGRRSRAPTRRSRARCCRPSSSSRRSPPRRPATTACTASTSPTRSSGATSAPLAAPRRC